MRNPLYKHIPELYLLWLKNDKPNCNAFKKIVILSGYGNHSLRKIYDLILERHTSETGDVVVMPDKINGVHQKLMKHQLWPSIDEIFKLWTTNNKPRGVIFENLLIKFGYGKHDVFAIHKHLVKMDTGVLDGKVKPSGYLVKNKLWEYRTELYDIWLDGYSDLDYRVFERLLDKNYNYPKASCSALCKYFRNCLFNPTEFVL